MLDSELASQLRQLSLVCQLNKPVCVLPCLECIHI